MGRRRAVVQMALIGCTVIEETIARGNEGQQTPDRWPCGKHFSAIPFFCQNKCFSRCSASNSAGQVHGHQTHQFNLVGLLIVFKSISDYALGQYMNPINRLLLRLTIYHHARQFRHYRDPPAVCFLFDFNRKQHAFISITPSGGLQNRISVWTWLVWVRLASPSFSTSRREATWHLMQVPVP